MRYHYDLTIKGKVVAQLHADNLRILDLIMSALRRASILEGREVKEN